MNKNLFFKIFVVFVFLIGLFILIQKVQADCGDPCTTLPKPGDTTSSGCNNSTYYRCQSNNNCTNASNNVERQTNSGYQKTRSVDCVDVGGGNFIWVCGGWSGCGGGSSPINIWKDCADYQICIGNTAWETPDDDYCECKGECLSDPTSPHLESGTGIVPNINVRLPIKLAWNKVPGASSYWYRAWKADPPTTTSWALSQATSSQFINNVGLLATNSGTGANPIWVIPASGNTTPCFLKLPVNTTFAQSTSTRWKIMPCCNADGTECKTWDAVSTSSFELSLAPQPVSPPDPDWNNETEMFLDALVPVTLKWCNVKEAEYYEVQPYILESGVETLHGDPIEIEPSNPYVSSISFYEDLDAYFNVDNTYRWEVSTCWEKKGLGVCTSSQKWGFETSPVAPGVVTLVSPPNNSSINNSINVPVNLIWTRAMGFNSFFYKTTKLSDGSVIQGTTSGAGAILDLSLNQVYSWTVNPCTDNKCQSCTGWLAPWQFRTTGRTPELQKPDNAMTDIVLPVRLDWEDVAGAGFYRIELARVPNFLLALTVWDGTSSASDLTLDYPTLGTSTWYWWRVRTCANNGRCGPPNNALFDPKLRNFETFNIITPTLIFPVGGQLVETAGNINFSWNPVTGAKKYHYIITLNGEELFNRMVSSNYASYASWDFSENGTYSWKVEACLDVNCNASGGWSAEENFVLSLTTPPEAKGGLVPCGKKYDNPDTPFNERESCQIIHIFLLLRNILNFALWKIATIFIILILLAVAGLFFISKGETTVMSQAKSVFKATLIGYAVIFGAWLLINLLLAFVGYKFEFFGQWWDIPL